MAAKTSLVGELSKGLWKDNPIVVLLLGLCPALAVSTLAYNGLGMGLATMVVLVGSNLLVSLIKGIVPKAVRIPIYIVVIASFVTIVDMLLKAYLVELSRNLGIFVPLIVVNCVILGRAEAFASRNSVGRSVLDGLGMALGFTASLFLLGTIREILGAGTLTLWVMGETVVKFNLFGEDFPGVLVMILPPGAFITLGVLLAIRAKIQKRLEAAR